MSKPNRFGKGFTEVNEKYGKKSLIPNGKYAPKHPSRILIAGPSGCHKTTVFMNLILGDDPDCLMKFTRLYVVAKDLTEPYYEYLQDLFAKLQETADNTLTENGETPDPPYAYFTSDPTEFDLDMIDKDEQNLIVFDDCILDLKGDQGYAMNKFFMRGRKKSASMIFITQDAFAKDLKFIRAQCDYLILFDPGSASNIRNFVAEVGINGDKLLEKGRAAWSERGFVMIDKNNLTNDLGVRIGFYP